MELRETMNGGLNMLYTNIIRKLLGLQDVIVTNVEKNEKNIDIYIEMEVTPHQCPSCGIETTKIHDYRIQKIKDINSFDKSVILHLKKRRYCCPHCGKRFYEANSFLARYQRITKRLTGHVIDKLSDERSFSSVAREVNMSVSTVIRIFDSVSYPKAKLPKTLSIDEFKGNTWGEKYQCILTDPVNKIVLDILPERYSNYLTSYFKEYSKQERSSVKNFVSDMWKPYSDISNIWFKEATQIVDKYHWIRQVIWAFESVRKEEQKKLSSELRKYFKRSKSLLIKRFDTLKDEDKQAVNVMLYYSVNISRAYFYKEEFLKILLCKNFEMAKKSLCEWIEDAEDCGIPQFQKCAKTMHNWYSGIANSLNTTYH